MTTEVDLLDSDGAAQATAQVDDTFWAKNSGVAMAYGQSHGVGVYAPGYVWMGGGTPVNNWQDWTVFVDTWAPRMGAKLETKSGPDWPVVAACGGALLLVVAGFWAALHYAGKP